MDVKGLELGRLYSTFTFCLILIVIAINIPIIVISVSIRVLFIFLPTNYSNVQGMKPILSANKISLAKYSFFINDENLYY